MGPNRPGTTWHQTFTNDLKHAGISWDEAVVQAEDDNDGETPSLHCAQQQVYSPIQMELVLQGV